MMHSRLMVMMSFCFCDVTVWSGLVRRSAALGGSFLGAALGAAALAIV